MDTLSWRADWTPVTNTEAHALTCATVSPGYAYSYPVSALPNPLQGLPGISEAFCSGYCTTYKSPEDVAVLGELVIARTDQGQGKAYVYLFGRSESTVCFAGPYKPYDGHYYETTSGVPIEKLFGQVPPNSGQAS